MSPVARSTLLFAVYFLGEGLLLLLAPNLLLGVLGQPPSHEPWIRLLGLTFCVLASYYLAMVRMDVKPFFAVASLGRILQFPLVLLMVAIDWAPPVVAVVQAVEFASGLHTQWLLREGLS